MPKYLLQASYTSDGVKGLAKDGGSKRRAAGPVASLASPAPSAGEGPLVRRSWPLGDLVQRHENTRGRVAYLRPSNYTPPEPAALAPL